LLVLQAVAALTENAARVAIPEDLEFDPSYARQRRMAGYLLGAAINALSGKHMVWDKPRDNATLAEQLREMALENGIVSFDEWHHAPACRSNNWSKMMLPTGPCTCGAAARRIR
jgi:hypothetical protein